MLAFAALVAVLPLSLAAPLVERATDISGSPVGFKLPVARGWADATDSASPCGGIAFGGNRTDFPMSGGDISLLTKADGDQVQINIAKSSEATKNSNFKSLIHEVAVTYRGHQCYNAPDLSTLGFSVGDEVTLQLTYVAGAADTRLYQCADVTIVATDAFVAAEGAFCVNGAYDYATPDTNDYSDDLSSGLTAGQKGGIGAGASIAGLLIIGGLAWFFMKKKKSAAAVANSGHSIDGRTLHGDNSSFASRDMTQKVSA
ncbi:hypothetical protein BCR35DRAFT_349312 [Leucosporidium creatinivorum]|uniref:Copper acquisition factor BIM1-like domain-containing protein n=1 Tax=Leucosporidium creatinivorum TaxID=106004 RepID=A0A1Y2G290_9BASI|nr:hypothetical protein BCR35DRAFT_349312 [Leucosporidium creatinivorum]